MCRYPGRDTDQLQNVKISACLASRVAVLGVGSPSASQMHSGGVYVKSLLELNRAARETLLRAGLKAGELFPPGCRGRGRGLGRGRCREGGSRRVHPNVFCRPLVRLAVSAMCSMFALCRVGVDVQSEPPFRSLPLSDAFGPPEVFAAWFNRIGLVGALSGRLTILQRVTPTGLDARVCRSWLPHCRY